MVGIRKILSALSEHDAAKAVVMKCLKNKGLSLDEFPRTRLSVETVAEGLTRAEDILEFEPGSKAADLRSRLKVMRRELEDAVA